MLVPISRAIYQKRSISALWFMISQVPSSQLPCGFQGRGISGKTVRLVQVSESDTKVRFRTTGHTSTTVFGIEGGDAEKEQRALTPHGRNRGDGTKIQEIWPVRYKMLLKQTHYVINTYSRPMSNSSSKNQFFHRGPPKTRNMILW